MARVPTCYQSWMIILAAPGAGSASTISTATLALTPGLITFFGVIVNAVTTFIATRTTARGQDKRQLFEMRQGVYAEYLAQSQRFYRAAAELHDTSSDYKSSLERLLKRPKLTAAAKHLTGLVTTMATLSATLRVIGSDDVVTRANAVSSSLDKLDNRARDGSVTAEEWEAGEESFHRSVVQFGEAARHSQVPKGMPSSRYYLSQCARMW